MLNIKRAGVVGIATLAVAGAGVASAAWLAVGVLPGSGQTAKLAPVTGEATVAPALFPGMKGDLKGSLTNPNPVAVKVVVQPPHQIASECEYLSTQAGALGSYDLGAGETKHIQMLNVVKLADNAPDSCQNVSFTVKLRTETVAGS